MLTEFDIERYLLISSIMLVILIDFTMSSNLVQAIVCLIFSYLIVATHFRLLNATYLAIVLILVYVGAISVLFLWLLMTIDEVTEAERVIVHREKEVEKPKQEEKTYENYYKYFVVRRIIHRVERFFKPLTDFLKEVLKFIIMAIKFIIIVLICIGLLRAFFFYLENSTEFYHMNPFLGEPYYIWSKQEFEIDDMFFRLDFLFYFLVDNIVILGYFIIY